MKLVVVRKIVLSVLSAWFALVVFTDFVVVPSVFITVSKRMEAAQLGMDVFYTLGNFEFFSGLFLFLSAGVVIKRFKTKRAAVLFSMATGLFAFALLGRFYLTPEITKTNQLKFSIDESSQQYEQLQDRHNFLHGVYIKLDSLKMLLLVAGMIGSFRSSRFDQEKVFSLGQRKKL